MVDIFGFFYTFHPAVAIILLFAVTLFIINLCYRFLMNQKEAKAIKERTKELNSQMKIAQKAGEKEKVSQLMSDMLKENNRLMKMSLKPMLVSMVLVILILPSLGVTYSDVAAKQDANNVTLNNNNYQLTISGDNVTLSSGGIALTCMLPCTEQDIGGDVWNLQKDGDNVKFARVVAVTPVPLPFIGSDRGWFSWYLIVSIPLMILMRKILKISM